MQIILRVSDEAEHRRRYEQPTITRERHLTNVSFELAQFVEQLILEAAFPWNTPILDNLGPPADTARRIRDLIEGHTREG